MDLVTSDSNGNVEEHQKQSDLQSLFSSMSYVPKHVALGGRPWYAFYLQSMDVSTSTVHLHSVFLC